MSIRSLTPPQDITWTRMLFSRDMIDTNFNDMNFPPKWRSSMAAYFFIVPEEETVDSYPNSRIVYLKLTCNITGWNPSESLLSARTAAEEVGTWDDMQRTLWETIISSGWAQKYWPCYGAIMQIAVYPNNREGVSPDDYPYIMDFEPKKRELFESLTVGSEILEGSEGKTSVLKGTTTSKGASAQAGGSFFGIGVSANASYGKENIENRTTDTSREARETESMSTVLTQMYQLFNGYHLGTNRALFVVAPRPHIVSDSKQTEFNLIDGERKLEGIQDIFLVVHLPKNHDGFCIQASLDTGHLATSNVPYQLLRNDDNLINEESGGVGTGGNTGDSRPNPSTPIKQLIITRRIAQSCGTFDENGNFTIKKLREPIRDIIIGEHAIVDHPVNLLYRVNSETNNENNRLNTANNLNIMQSKINRMMLDSSSSINNKSQKFEKTDTFKSLAALAAKKMDLTLNELESKGYINKSTVMKLAKIKITTAIDLFSETSENVKEIDIKEVRNILVDKLIK